MPSPISNVVSGLIPIQSPQQVAATNPSLGKALSPAQVTASFSQKQPAAPAPSTGTNMANFYQMTPQEASSGPSGVSAYQTRIANYFQQQQPSTAQSTAQQQVSAQPQLNLPNNSGLAQGPTTPNQLPGPTGGTPPPPSGTYYDVYGNLLSSSSNQPVKSLAVPAATPAPSNPNLNPYTATAPTFPGLVGTLASTAAQPSPQYVEAQNQYLQANQALADLRTQAAQQNANILGGRTNLAEAGGEQGLLQTLEAGKEAALTGEMSAAQAAAQTATGQQQAQQAGLGAAAGLGFPIPGQALGFYNPLTGQFQTNAQGGGVPFAGGEALQGVQLGQQSAQLGAVQRQAQTLTSQLTDLLNSTDINKFFSSGDYTLAPATGLLQLGASLVGDPNYQTFSNLVNDLISRYSSILTPAGGNPTDTRLQIAQSLINKQASPQSIIKVINSLDQQASSVISKLNPATAGSSAQAAGTISAGGYSYKQNPDGTYSPQ